MGAFQLCIAKETSLVLVNIFSLQNEIDMMPLIVLLLSFLILRIVGRFYPKINPNKAGRIAFGLMFLFTGVSHFMFAEGMIMSLPAFIPFKEFLVYLTGVLEFFFAALFTVDRYKQLTAKLIIAFLIAVLPANIWAAMHHVDIPNASYNGAGLAYLWFRIPLQVFFIAWVFHFGIKPITVHAFRGKKHDVKPSILKA